jgi:CO/xanthine dehydrogenase FAD-binding subunit
MTEMKYFEPKSVTEAISLLSTYKDGGKILAGGTALLVLMKQKIYMPECLINIKKIKDLHRITSNEGEGITVGALNRLSDIEFNPIIEKNCPSVIEGIKSIGSPLIRNLATVGGNICHGDPASGFILQLIAMDSKLRLVGSDVERWVPIDEFYVDLFETKIRVDEILTEIYIPLNPSNSGSAYLKHCARKAVDRPIISVAALVTLNPKALICEKIRIAIGGSAKTPVRARGAEQKAQNRNIDLKVIEEIGDAAYEEVSPTGDIYNSAPYKREMVRVFVKRAIRLALERA